MKKTLLLLLLLATMVLSLAACGKSNTYEDYDLNAHIQFKDGVDSYKGIKILQSDILKHLKDARKEIISALVSAEKIKVEKLVEKDVAQAGDVVTVTYKGTPEGAAAADDKFSSTNEVQITVGTDAAGLPAEFDDKLIGAMKGGKVETDLLTYPAEMENADLAGKKAKFEITVVSVARPQYHTVHDGDTIVVTYSGDVMNGETVATAGAVVGKGETVKLGDNDMPDGFDAAVLGKRVGETAKFTVTYGADAAEAVAGKTVALSVKIDDITETTYKEVTKDTLPVVKKEDTVNINYEGILVGETEPFKGGTDATAAGKDLEIGSGEFIAGFEEGLIGCPVGVKVTLRLKFPADYGTASMQNKEVDFTVTVNSISRTDENALTLALLNEQLKTNYTSFEEWEQAETEEYKLSAVQEKMLEKTTVLVYPKNEVTNYAKNLISTYEMYAANYGYTLSGYVSLIGYSNVEAFYDYAISYAQNNVKSEMALLLIAQKEGITLSDGELQTYLDENYADNGYESAKKFKKEIGEDVIRMVALCEKTAEQLRTWCVVEDDTQAQA